MAEEPKKNCGNCARGRPVDGQIGHLKLNLWCGYLDTYTRDDFDCEYHKPKEEVDEQDKG